ncbi:DUF5103 domain-containing protein [Christiangramia sp. SM2212]|uniref:DUF5103 domain-containing protein n=1 Tax=Christiangramia sediminicola TaxID=3073267 RepID=A0ABU1EMF9_9FLAO|nr:DUF5103 domain-containing protein [Christiangramia sp. SM2212]MDR5589570.1 DUF5103 domain-containing protein [Christiangramia sp. SM2212]
MRAFLFILFLAGISFSGQSQAVQETPPPSFIRTVIFQGDSTENTGNPIIRSGSRISLKFDDIIGDEADYYYTIEHYNFDWTPSQLSKNEYLEGFDNVRIIDYTNALNTLQPFTHYKLSIPNKNVKQIKVSGNYMLKVFNSNRELVFSRKFMIYDPIAQVSAEIKRSRDLNFIDEKQVVNFSVNSPDLLLKNPDENVKVSIIQNYNLKLAITDLKPQYTIANELIYRYDNESSFWGGNEFLQFDNKEIRVTTSDISSVELGELYHHFLFLDFTRGNQPYTYNPDINGGFVVRNIQADNSDREAEYVWMHFRLKNYDIIEDAEIHIYGGFNNFELDKSTLMSYNEKTGYYEGARLFKQGYYNYKYVLLNKDGSIDDGFISGNFDETENSYTILVYYHPPGARYDQLIGIGYANSENIRN